MQNLKIWQKTFDMAIYGKKCLKQFPKEERHVMAAEIRQGIYRMMQLIVRANKARNKTSLLLELDTEIEVLRAMLRLASDPEFRYLPIKKYEIWSKQLNEIGRMLGGWMKSAK